MSIRSKLSSTCLALTLIYAGTFCGQARESGSANGRRLRQHYDIAQQLQRTGKLSEAAQEYRAFLSDALGELAIGYVLARDYAQAARLFDETLTMEPDSPLLLDYARAALVLGDPGHAKTLTTDFIQKHPGDREGLAQAHQILGRALLQLNRDRDARKELEAAVALDPTFQNGYDLAVACLDLEDEKCAVQIFDELEASFGDSAEVHVMFGRAYADSDFQARAITEFRKAIEENPQLQGTHYLLAVVLLATGGDASHVQSAETELEKELAIFPNDSRTYAALGKIASNGTHYAEAETYLKKAISLEPQTPDGYLYLGQMYYNTKRFAEAETALRQCIRLTTDVSRNRFQAQNAHFLLGRILMQKGEQDAAHAEMSIAKDLADKTLTQDKEKLAALLDTAGSQSPQESGQDAASLATVNADPQALRRVEALREQVKLAVADSYNNLGAITATFNNYSGAVRYFEHAAMWNPSLDGLDYNWGRAAFAGLQFADAIMPLSRYLKAHPDDTGARSVLAISQFMGGNYAGCIETLQPLIGKTELAPETEYAYAESMIRTGKLDAGTERLRALESSHPENPDVHRSLGDVLEWQGEKQKAIDELRMAVHLSPRDPELHYDLGKVELESGDSSAAISELEESVWLSPNTEKFHRELADAYSAARRPADAQKEMETCALLRTRTQNGASSHQITSPNP